FQAEDGIRDFHVTGVQTCALPISHKRAKAVSRVLAGLTVAILIGNPLATWLGQFMSWRYAFALVGIIAITTIAMVAIFLPADPEDRQSVVSGTVLGCARYGRSHGQ